MFYPAPTCQMLPCIVHLPHQYGSVIVKLRIGDHRCNIISYKSALKFIMIDGHNALSLVMRVYGIQTQIDKVIPSKRPEEIDKPEREQSAIAFLERFCE